MRDEVDGPGGYRGALANREGLNNRPAGLAEMGRVPLARGPRITQWCDPTAVRGEPHVPSRRSDLRNPPPARGLARSAHHLCRAGGEDPRGDRLLSAPITISPPRPAIRDGVQRRDG